MEDPSRRPDLREDQSHGQYLYDRIAWHIRLRWIAALGVLAGLALALALSLVSAAAPLLALVGVMVAGNFALARLMRRLGPESTGVTLERVILLQVSFDVLILAGLIYFGGSVSNPFVLFLVFPMCVAAMLLPLRTAAMTAIGTTLVHGATVIGEVVGWLPRYRLSLPGTSLLEPLAETIRESHLFLAGYLVAFLLAELGVVYFVGTLAARYRQAELERRRQESLAEARKRLARAGAISAGVARAVRNPLQGLMNGVDLLRSDFGAADRLEVLDLMSEAVTRIEHTTRKLLTLAPESSSKRSPFHTIELVNNAVRFVELQARERGVDLLVQPGKSPRILADPEQFVGALVGILENAIEASGKGGVATIKLDEAFAEALIEVSDSGPGMSAEDVEQAFEPFFTRKANGDAAGLGLAVTRRVLEDHGGTVTITSEPGCGTVVRLKVPSLRGTALMEGHAR